MTDITFKVNKTLKSFGQQISLEKNTNYFNIYTQDILIMLNYIYKLMVQSEEKYFSSSNVIQGAFTEQEKEEFDNQVMQQNENFILTRNSIKIGKTKLNDLQEMLKKQQSFLQSKNKSEYAHKEIALGCLTSQLNKVTIKFKAFKTHRSRQKEKAISLTRFKQEKPDKLKYNVQQDIEEEDKNEELASENKQLFMKFNDNLQDILKNQEQIKEISESIQKMSEILYRQDLTTEQILNDASSSLKLVESANKNLIEANKLNEKFGFCWSILFLSLGILILFYDFINR